MFLFIYFCSVVQFVLLSPVCFIYYFFQFLCCSSSLLLLCCIIYLLVFSSSFDSLQCVFFFQLLFHYCCFFHPFYYFLFSFFDIVGLYTCRFRYSFSSSVHLTLHCAAQVCYYDVASYIFWFSVVQFV